MPDRTMLAREYEAFLELKVRVKVLYDFYKADGAVSSEDMAKIMKWPTKEEMEVREVNPDTQEDGHMD